MSLPRPQAGQYPAYFTNYLNHVPAEADPLALLQTQAREMHQLLGSLSEEQGAAAYAPGKWTIKELLLHLIDAERIFAYRALRFARADEQALPGWDENAYTPEAGANARSMSSLLEEYDAVRQATLTLFRSFTPAQLERSGTASGHPVSVRALVFIIPGHEAHHLRILRERYLPLFS